MAAIVVAFAIALVATPAVRRLLLRSDLVDRPNHRSSHVMPTARGGGLAVALAAGITLMLTGPSIEYQVLLAGATLLGLVGFVDDRRSIHPLPRLVAQLVVPAVSMWWLVGPAEGVSAILLAVGGVGWCAGYINAFNFMDGINGISVVQATAAGGALAGIGLQLDPVSVDGAVSVGIAIAGAALGFGVFNAASKIFLGDVGSYFCGYWLAAAAVIAVAYGAPVESVLMPFTYYVVDTSTTLWRRWQRGAPIFDAHREHAYQSLVAAGWHHLSVSSLVAVVVGVAAAISVVTVTAGTMWRLLGLAASLTLAFGFCAWPRSLERGAGS